MANVIIGSIVFFGKQSSRVHQSFGLFTIAVFAWIVTNALYGIISPELRYPIALLSYAAALMIGVFTLLFSIYFTNVRVGMFTKASLILFGILTATLSAVPGLIATGVTHDLRIVTNIWALSGYGIVLILYFGASLGLLVSAQRRYRGVDRQRVNFILVGLLGAILLGVFFNLVLPYVGDYRYVQLGPVSSLLLVSATAYAIVKHGLFDIRAVVARILSYVFTLLIIAILYVLVVFNLLGLFFPTSTVSSSNVALYTFFAVVTALTFQPVKKFFDVATDKLFYRRDYLPEQVLADFSDITATEINLKRLVKSVIDELLQTIKPESISVHIKSSPRQAERVFSVGDRRVTLSSYLQRQLGEYPHRVIIVDYLGDEYKKLRETLSKERVSMLVVLRTSREKIGYLTLGPKRNGGIYASRDERLFNAIGNELALAIQNSLRFEEIQEFNQTLQDKVDLATERLRNTNRKLKQLDATKDEFVSMASHQLRTPLTSVKGYLSMVLEGDAGKLNPSQEKLLKEAYTSSERMVRLISDFLNVSRLRTGKFVIERSAVNLASLVGGEINQLAATAATRELRLQYTKPVDFPTLRLDKGKIQQVVMNLIDNAIFYSHPGGDIMIELLRRQGEVVFRVKDEGIGVPAAEKKQLFTKFYRATNARRQRPDGTGIGLFMAQKIILAHGGVIIFESTENKGSTFGFRLPIDQPDDGMDSKRLG